MWLSRATLDIIGLAGNLLSITSSLAALIARSQSHVGFNHSFDSLQSPTGEKETNNIYGAIRSVLTHTVSPDPLFAIQLFFPMFRVIVSTSPYQEGREQN